MNPENSTDCFKSPNNSPDENDKSILDLPDLFLISVLKRFDLKSRLKLGK
jgi:hypothetical protein